MKPYIQISPAQAYQKLKHYCSYQERSHTEVKEKLYGFGLHKPDVEKLLTQLIEEGFLNEERFAIQFAGGKFRIKKWGRIKIKYELKQKQISAYNIKKALSQIDEQEYFSMLQTLAAEKWKTLKHEQKHIRQIKTQQYLLQKGYEADLNYDAIKMLMEKEK